MTIAETVRLIKLNIEPRAGEESLQQAKWLVAAVLGLEPAALSLHMGMEVSREQLEILGELSARRRDGEPLQYILGEWSFMGLPFYVDERALIPRQDTETLCQAALDLIQKRGYKSVLDLCAGGGCLGISIRALSDAAVDLSDRSEDALALARENAELNQVEVGFLCGDLFDAVIDRYDLIVCNPPYLSAADMASLQEEIKREPRMALDGGFDGLDFYRRISMRYRDYLNENGALLLEIGGTQAKAASKLFGEPTRTLRDSCGHARVLIVGKAAAEELCSND